VDVTFVLAHLSDPHIGPLPKAPLRHMLNKRFLGAMNWHSRRATLHDMAVLDRVIDDVHAHKPDHIALTGDLVNIGYAPEFAAAFMQLARLGTPEGVSLVPGNHDAYVADSLPAMARHFRPYMLGDDASPHVAPNGLPPFPYLRRRGRVALIGVNSALPTGPLMATGRVDSAELERLGDMLGSLKTEGVVRVIMIHHPPYQGGARFARGLKNAPAFEALIARHGAELIIHGHNHRFFQHALPTPSGLCRVVGVGSASAVPGTPHHCAEYNLFRLAILDDVLKIHIEQRGYDPASGGISTLAEWHI
jgi:3',5'-cyclic AMP phosphodiesterase CpdA